MLIGAGLSYHPNASDEIFVRYDGYISGPVDANAISAGAKFRW
jgi:hypothetical protein